MGNCLSMPPPLKTVVIYQATGLIRQPSIKTNFKQDAYPYQGKNPSTNTDGYL
jgi:hypothetical protein